MSVCWLVMSDGRRDYLRQAITSGREMLVGPITRRIIHDDGADGLYRRELVEEFPDFEVIGTPTRAGFGGAYRNAWDFVAKYVLEPFLFSTEDDFTFNSKVPLEDMIEVLRASPYLVQLCLKRQPWNDLEKRAGGIVEQRPESYQDFSMHGHSWLEHRLFFSTNSSLFRTSLTARGWPNVKFSEGMFSHRLFAEDVTARAAFWGKRGDKPMIHHIGTHRVGRGY